MMDGRTAELLAVESAWSRGNFDLARQKLKEYARKYHDSDPFWIKRAIYCLNSGTTIHEF